MLCVAFSTLRIGKVSEPLLAVRFVNVNSEISQFHLPTNGKSSAHAPLDASAAAAAIAIMVCFLISYFVTCGARTRFGLSLNSRPALSSEPAPRFQKAQCARTYFGGTIAKPTRSRLAQPSHARKFPSPPFRFPFRLWRRHPDALPVV